MAVAGASGYIGGRLTRRLLELGYTVRCLARHPGKILGREWPADSKLEVLETDLEKCLQVAERIRGAVNEYSFEKAGHLTASFGAATFAPGQSLDDLLHIVDLGMYAAKNKGGNQVSSAMMTGDHIMVS